MSNYKIHGINGPVVTIQGKTDLGMMEMVYVGRENLIGEVISLSSDRAIIQVYEETTGLSISEEVVSNRFTDVRNAWTGYSQQYF